MILDDERFEGFLEKRRQLIERLDATRIELDEWLAAHDVHGDLGELAYLEGVLHVRRGLLTELANLDDEIIELLIEIRGRPGRG